MQLPVASGGPIFSLAREKMGEKRVLGRVWCILRVQFRVYLKTPNVTGSEKFLR